MFDSEWQAPSVNGTESNLPVLEIISVDEVCTCVQMPLEEMLKFLQAGQPFIVEECHEDGTAANHRCIINPAHVIFVNEGQFS